MPEKIIIKNDDGSEEEREFYTNDDLEMTKKEYEDKMTELQSSSSAENFRALREKADSWEKRAKALEAKGKTIDDNGDVVDFEQKVSMKDVEDRARQIARGEQLNLKKEELLSRYDDDMRKVVEHNYNKLVNGEEVSVGNMDTFFAQAELLSTPGKTNPIRTAISQSRGNASINSNKSDFGDSEDGKSLANNMGLNI